MDTSKRRKTSYPAGSLPIHNTDRKALFVLGGAGSGKNETATSISRLERVDLIDTNDIRKTRPSYSGKNAHLFQRAADKGVSFLLNYAFEHNISFILNGDFADYRPNIARAQKADFGIEVVFLYRDKHAAREYTLQREKIDGRSVS